MTQGAFGGNGGMGGCSGRFAQFVWQPYTFPSSQSYTVGTDMQPNTLCAPGATANGSATSMGPSVAGSIASGVAFSCPNSVTQPAAASGGSAGGAWQQADGSNNGTVASNGASPLQGSRFAAAFAGFTQRTITVAPGGSLYGSGHLAGGGISISGFSPIQAAGSWVNSIDNGGQRFGGGWPRFSCNVPGGRGASGIIDIEWSAP